MPHPTSQRAPWRVLVSDLAELVLPQQCVVCGRFGSPLHERCLEALPRADGPRCPRCWRPSRVQQQAECERCRFEAPVAEARRAAFRFEGAARRALLEAKFRGVSALLAPLARAAAPLVAPQWPLEVVVPVPLHPARLRSRGYNQAALLADELGRRLELPVIDGLIERARATPPQAGLPAGRRLRNVEGVFRPRALRTAPPRAVLLVDDVTTTGATLEAAARALSVGGVAAVYALAVAIED